MSKDFGGCGVDTPSGTYMPERTLSAEERQIADSVAGAEDPDVWDNIENTPVPAELQRDLDSGASGVLFWRALLMPVRPQKRSRGGIIMVDESRQNAQYLTYIGKVVALGPLWCEGPNFSVYAGQPAFWQRLTGKTTRASWKPDLKPGDWVIYGRHAGQRIEYKGVKLLLVNDDEKLMKIASPEGWRIYS